MDKCAARLAQRSWGKLTGQLVPTSLRPQEQGAEEGQCKMGRFRDQVQIEGDDMLRRVGDADEKGRLLAVC